MKSIRPYLKITAATIVLMALLDQGIRTYDTWRGALIVDALVELGPSFGIGRTYHPFLQYTSPPSFDGWIRHAEPNRRFFVRTNAHGFRSDGFYPKFPGRTRIVLLGDSFVYGYNANQDATLASTIKQLAQSDGLSNLDVLSLGVASYSGLRYAMLAKLYFDYLKPDIVIVALDQSDFMEDVSRKSEYVFDNDNCPLYLKDANYSRHDTLDKQIVFDDKGAMVKVPKFGRRFRLRLISGFYNRIAKAARPSSQAATLSTNQTEKIRAFLSKPPLRYEELLAANGQDLTAVMPKAISIDTIPFTLEKAEAKYTATLDSLACVKHYADRVNAKMFVSSYPYPWFVSTTEAAGFLINRGAGAPIDFTGNRVNPRLAKYYSEKIGVVHLDAYPIFDGNAGGMYGTFDPHFSEAGYHRYAEFLYFFLRDELKALSKRH